MERRIVLWIVIAAMFLAVLILTFKSGGSIAATKTVGGAVSTAVKSAASSAMVGGC